jgi:hypothetical protein
MARGPINSLVDRVGFGGTLPRFCWEFFFKKIFGEDGTFEKKVRLKLVRSKNWHGELRCVSNQEDLWNWGGGWSALGGGRFKKKFLIWPNLVMGDYFGEIQHPMGSAGEVRVRMTGY